MSDSSWYENPAARAWRTAPIADDVIGFHRTLPGYAPTALVELPELAVELRVGRVFAKEESCRLGLPAFKVLGAAYAIARALAGRAGLSGGIAALDELREVGRAGERVTLVAATDGNHGRAVAHVARLLGLPAHILFPNTLTAGARAGIVGEGAAITELAADYDAAVEAARDRARSLGDAGMLIQDTSWPGYETIPQWIVDGYSTLFVEADAQLVESGAAGVDLVVVPAGVGSLAQAAVRHYRSGESAPALLSAEPAYAPSIIESLRAGRIVTVPTRRTIMTGLNCGTASAIAWPYLQAGLDAATTVSEPDARAAADELERLGVDAGPCGGAALAAARAALGDESRRRDLGIESHSVVMLVSTEGRAANPLP